MSGSSSATSRALSGRRRHREAPSGRLRRAHARRPATSRRPPRRNRTTHRLGPRGMCFDERAEISCLDERLVEQGSRCLGGQRGQSAAAPTGRRRAGVVIEACPLHVDTTRPGSARRVSTAMFRNAERAIAGQREVDQRVHVRQPGQANLVAARDDDVGQIGRGRWSEYSATLHRGADRLVGNRHHPAAPPRRDRRAARCRTPGSDTRASRPRAGRTRPRCCRAT